MSEDGERERHINMHMSPEVMAGVYANFANVSHSDYEFTITFARLDHEVEDDEIPGVVVSRVSASPAVHARADRRARGQLLEVVHPRGDQEPARVPRRWDRGRRAEPQHHDLSGRLGDRFRGCAAVCRYH